MPPPPNDPAIGAAGNPGTSQPSSPRTIAPGSSPAVAASFGATSSATPSSAKDRTLVSVVWCRQVDNEAESPGYTTVPTDFPGRKETLDTVRIVGNLAINAADTHDYWDPDPTSKLAYYHNLFLYPANGGTYLCLGRMFLSTEDRPRLGMKTLVLDAGALLESENLGQTIRRWYGSMGNPGRPSGVEGRADRALLSVLSDGLTYQGLDPDAPVLAFASDNFLDAVEAMLCLLERAPAALALLSGILIFPYFLPVGRVNLSEFTEKFPLTLALARIPRNEAGGDRHQKRLSGWSAQPVRVLDLTQGVPQELSTRTGPLPPVSWWVANDRSDLATELRRSIDRVELPRYRAGGASAGAGGGGRARRRELARLSSSMSALASVLSRPPAQRKKLEAATLALAQPYLEGLPAGAATAEVAPEAPTPATGQVAASIPGGTEPPWRRPPRLREGPVGVVPGPREAPGGALPPGAERGAATPAGPLAPGPAPPSAAAPEGAPGAGSAPAGPPFAESLKLSPALLDELQQFVDGRIGESRTRSGDLDPDVVGRLERDLERRLEARANLLVSPEALEARIVEVLSRRPPPSPPELRQLLTDDAKQALAEVVNAVVEQRLAALQGAKSAKAPLPFDPKRVDDRLIEVISGKTSDHRLEVLLGERIQKWVSDSVAEDRRSTDDRLDRILGELQERAKAQAELETTIRNEVRFLDEKLQTLMGRLIPLLRKTWLKIDELDKRPSAPSASAEQKMKRLRDELWAEMHRLEVDLSERTRIILDRVESNVQNQGRLWLTLVSQLSNLSEQRRELRRLVEESREDSEPSEQPAPGRTARPEEGRPRGGGPAGRARASSSAASGSEAPTDAPDL